MKSPNSIFRTFLLAVSVLLGLFALSMLPEWGIGSWQSKPVDMLSDMVRDTTATKAENVTLPPIPADSCKDGVTCISDYATETNANMDLFYSALSEANQRPVRIAYIGDSFIEADILTGALRDLLQEHYGGMGVGYVTIDHVSAQSRTTISQTRSGFSMHNALDKKYDSSLPGLSGYYFLTSSNASADSSDENDESSHHSQRNSYIGGPAFVELSGRSDFSSHLARAEVSQFILLPRGNTVNLTVSTDGGNSEHFTVPGGAGLQVVTFEAPMQRVRWSVSGHTDAVFYGMTMDGRTGVTLDNFALRGSTGLTLPKIPIDRLQKINESRHYDLVVLQHGVNVMRRGKTDYSKYGQDMVNIISHLRTAMPNTAILVVGIGDRGGKLPTGEIGTLPEVPYLIEAQAKAAAQAGVAFWNMYDAMGGKDAMVKFANSRPALAARDYTHISMEGGKRIARSLFDAIIWGHELYTMKHSGNYQ